MKGQEKLLASHVLIIGAGGLGSATSIYLASSGIGKLTICDFDKVELSNLQRQILHNDAAIGMNKAKSAKNFLEKLNPNIKVEAIEDKLDMDSMKKIARVLTSLLIARIIFILDMPLIKLLMT
jgi:molybdopterin/thiamine biosynthesis adenylyltransferase